MDIESFYKDNVVWKVVDHSCQECGRDGFKVAAYIGDTEVLSGVIIDKADDAIAFINSLKKAGIIRDNGSS